MVLFIKPNEEEMQLTRNVLSKFGEASGLHTNMQESCAIPVQCDQYQPTRCKPWSSHSLMFMLNSLVSIWISLSLTRS
jgi:hypothetical protein